MSHFAKTILARLARRIHENPTSANLDDIKKLARGILLLTGEKL